MTAIHLVTLYIEQQGQPRPHGGNWRDLENFIISNIYKAADEASEELEIDDVIEDMERKPVSTNRTERMGIEILKKISDKELVNAFEKVIQILESK